MIPRRCEPCRKEHRLQVKREVAARYYERNRDRVKGSVARYRDEHPDAVRDTNRKAKKKWVDRNREKVNRRNNARRRERYANDPEYRERLRVQRICRNYGISQDEYWAMLREQSGRCLICDREPEEGSHLHVDHNHKCCPEQKWSCGECVRGLLCPNCNRGLAAFGDDAGRMRAALAYLEP